MHSILDRRIKGTPGGAVLHELYSNSAHFPLANILLELLLRGPGEYLLELDLYFLVAAALAQAFLVGRWEIRGTTHPVLGNLIGPAVYSCAEFIAEGPEFLLHANHLAYWGFALSIGLLQWLQARSSRLRPPLLLLEHVIRTCIVLVMYVILEFTIDDYGGLTAFLNDAPHAFVAMVLPLLGLIVGLAHLNSARYLQTLRRTTEQLRQYSEWLFGKELLHMAVSDPQALSLARHERAMVFMDIRGFTAWSEARAPEEVVELINDYYAACEPVWRDFQAIKVKLTADEVMLVFGSAQQAVDAAQALRSATLPLLGHAGLTAGCGVHYGPVVEGLMGTEERRSYDLLGDSVNTAKRLCDAAGGSEILISQAVHQQIGARLSGLQQRSLQVKGKQQPLTAYALP
ncbi:MAG: adenylate/guanylate cyclase domain-containing protein [Thiohalomonadaceae bacterium]